jgi:hypothetical protein
MFSQIYDILSSFQTINFVIKRHILTAMLLLKVGAFIIDKEIQTIITKIFFVCLAHCPKPILEVRSTLEWYMRLVQKYI